MECLSCRPVILLKRISSSAFHEFCDIFRSILRRIKDSVAPHHWTAKGSSFYNVRKVFRKTNIFYPLIRTNFACVLNGWPLIILVWNPDGCFWPSFCWAWKNKKSSFCHSFSLPDKTLLGLSCKISWRWRKLHPAKKNYFLIFSVQCVFLDFFIQILLQIFVFSNQISKHFPGRFRFS